MNSTRMVSVKTEADLPDLGVEVHLQVIDGNVEAIVIGTGEDQIRIAKTDSYSSLIKVTKPQQASTKTVYVVEGKLLGLTDYCSEEFDEEYLASQQLNNLKSEHNQYGDELGLGVVEKVVEYYEDKI